MSFDGGGVGNCNKKLRVCVARTVSSKGRAEGCIEMIEDVACVCTILCMYALLGGGSGVEGTVYCSKSTLDLGLNSDSSEKESETVSHESVSSSQ